MKLKNRKCIRFLLIVAVILVSELMNVAVAAQAERLKDTYASLLPEFAHCSPLLGAVWWETGLLKRYFMYGNIDDQGNGDATIKLMHMMFRLDQKNFLISELAAHCSATTIGKIVGWLETQRLKAVQLKAGQQATGDDQASVGKSNDVLVAELAALIENDDDFKRSCNDPLVSEEVKKLCLAIMASMGESSGQELYPPATTYAILLALLYKKTMNKPELDAYFAAVQQEFNDKSIFKPEGEQSPEDTAFESTVFSQIYGDIKKKATGDIPEGRTWIENLVIFSLYPSGAKAILKKGVLWLQRHYYFLRDLENDAGIKIDTIKLILSADEQPSEVSEIIASKLISTLLEAELKSLLTSISSISSIKGKCIFHKILIDRGFTDYYADAIAVAAKGMESLDNSVRRVALDLFKKLFEKEQGFTQAAAAARAGMRSKDDGIQRGALALYKALFAKINPDMQRGNTGMRWFYNTVFGKGLGFNEAITAASRAMKSDSVSVQVFALNLYKMLLEKGQGFKEAIAAASLGMKSGNPDMQKTALNLYKTLLKKEQGFNEVIESANQAMKRKDYQGESALYKVLVEVASEGADNSNLDVQKSALGRLGLLVEKGQGFDAAIAAAKKGVDSTDPGVQQAALNLYKALVERGQDFDAAIVAANMGMTSSEKDVQPAALALYKALVEVARKDANNSNSVAQKTALGHLGLLVEKGQGFDAAIAAAKKGVDST
ncbi:hypothetical protein FJ364_03645, partial [Candidatus Dependentiae bacterium]|nr:hypothetical protein [Candidatus Dependentiae bacterium]